ncbi:hypothetical protein G5I_08787 [Acromyrmex echinatior]|uniref:Uncharacterized protein n=1 Tax=Acromyrmex echinatior TaxID=103372 RepID=F4WSF6_ACREC|nr:hypothetical protein G5I_08787 [Acromyrmex echinatior]
MPRGRRRRQDEGSGGDGGGNGGMDVGRVYIASPGYGSFKRKLCRVQRVCIERRRVDRRARTRDSQKERARKKGGGERKRRERDSAKREQERETERGASRSARDAAVAAERGRDEGNEERERGGETAADRGLPVVGEVRWQSINIQNRRRVRETEGGRATEQASKQANERAATDRE